MSCQTAARVALGVLVLLLCDGPVCGLLPDLYMSDNGTSGLANTEETSPDEETGPIFVHVDAQKFIIPCKPAKTDFAIGMNPTYNWILEDGETHSVQGGSCLTLHKFRAEESGRYACTVAFAKENQTYYKTFYHTVVGYHIRGELQVLLIFQTSSCDGTLTSEFMKTLHEDLSQVVSHSHSHCELLPGSTTCFPTLEQPLDEFNLQVELKVSPLGEDWDESCSPKIDALALECYHSAVRTNLQQAKEAITLFMEKNKRFPLGESVALADTFVNTFLNFLEGGKCQRGYGQTQELLARCPDCCTLCPPGTYSEAAVDSCVLCPIGSYTLHYGETICHLCQHNWLTLHPGARKAEDCKNVKVPPSRRFPVLMVAFCLPPLCGLCLIVLQKRDSSTPKDKQFKQQKEDTAPAGYPAPEDSQEHAYQHTDNEGVTFPLPSELEEQPGGVMSPLPLEPEEQPEMENVVFPPSSPVSDADNA